jgi:hypothetical protein
VHCTIQRSPAFTSEPDRLSNGDFGHNACFSYPSHNVSHQRHEISREISHENMVQQIYYKIVINSII